jgi:UDPglucose 6-dehydrogenase
LLERGAKVKAHDPVAMDRAQVQHPGLGLVYCASPDQVFADSDAVVLVTEWPEYRDLAWEDLRTSMRRPVVLDGRNYLDRERLRDAGFQYVGFGR